MNKKPVITIENVNFFYEKGKPAETQALKNINLTIEPGCFVSFFGPSGCGKSTMLYMISGIDKPASGRIIINDEDFSKYDSQQIALFRQTKLGLIFQNFNLIPSISVLENVGLPMAFLGIVGEERNKHVMELLKRMGIEKLAHRLPYELSGGQQQRVAIARALANDPPIILADEPTGNLDSVNAKNTLDLLKGFAKEGKTVILVTHEAWGLTYADKIFHMKDGSIIKTEIVGPHAEGGGSEAQTDTLEHRSKLLTSIFMRGYSEGETKRFEDLIALRFANTIDRNRLQEELDKPFAQGGVGFWKQKAVRIANEIEEIIEKGATVIELNKRLHNKPELTLNDELTKLDKWIFEGHNITLSTFQTESLHEALRSRLSNVITTEHFQKVLALPKAKGGVGLNMQTSMRLAERLDTLLTLENFPK